MLNDANVIIKIKEYRNYLFQLRQTCFLGIDGFEATSKSISVHISPNLAAKNCQIQTLLASNSTINMTNQQHEQKISRLFGLL